ncbi:flagellar hook-length control protein FliK [Janthinobacterium aquaticum]|uniref:flagellar hook-length control protein FliK n=1 Tax=Janthinobacterium sp. FT58W TaxID=2654254 RepID=UPI0012643672|nr:flagellar hook-length control protein FliK [Janthinobacterium sp. FT58W]KAB8044450.1 hypothetical protein GCM43_04415 [Janthinobacterium sp. FT58W]
MNTSFNLINTVGTQSLLDMSMPGVAAAAPAVATTAVVPPQAVQLPGASAPALPLFAQSMDAAVNNAPVEQAELPGDQAAKPVEAAPQPADENVTQASQQAGVLPAMASPLLTPSVAPLPGAPLAAGEVVDGTAPVKTRASETVVAAAPITDTAATPPAATGAIAPERAPARAPAAHASPPPLVMTASLLSSTFTFRNFGQAGASAPAADTRPALAAAAPQPQAMAPQTISSQAAQPTPQREPLVTQPTTTREPLAAALLTPQVAALPAAASSAAVSPAAPRPDSALPPADDTPADIDDASPAPAAPSALAQQMAVASTLAAPLVATIMPAVKFSNSPAPAAIGNVDRALPRTQATGPASPAIAAITTAGVTDAPPVLRAAEAGTVLPLDSARAVGARAAQSAPAASFVLPGDNERSTPAAPAATVNAASGLGALMGAGTASTATQSGDTIKLNGPAQQWQEPLREALGERLQTQIGRNSEHAVIRLDPPMLGRIEISIRHQAGALQVNLSASNSEVLRQLQGIGENMRSDLAQRQYTEVAVNINATPRSAAAQAFAEHDGRGQRQPGRQQDDAEPGRALSDGAPAGATFAMHEREYN